MKGKKKTGYLITTVISAATVVWYLVAPSSQMFANFVVMLHVWFAFLLVINLFALGGVLVASRRPLKIDTSDSMMKSVREFYRAWHAWWWRGYKMCVQLPYLLFIGIVMGNWSLLTIASLCIAFGVLVTGAGESLYRNLPGGMKTGYTEVELLEQGKSPWRKAADRRREQKKRKEEARQSIVDGMLDNT